MTFKAFANATEARAAREFFDAICKNTLGYTKAVCRQRARAGHSELKDRFTAREVYEMCRC